MTFSLSFAGVKVNLIASSGSSVSAPNAIRGVRHCNGFIEAELQNFTGKIVISEEALESMQQQENNNHEVELESKESNESPVVVDAMLEEKLIKKEEMMRKGQALRDDDEGGEVPLSEEAEGEVILTRELASPSNNVVPPLGNIMVLPPQEPLVPYDPFNDENALIQSDAEFVSTDQDAMKVGIDSDDGDDDEAKKIQKFEANLRRTRFDLSNLEQPKSKLAVDLSLHELCASEYADIYELSAMLKAKPELAAVADEFGDYPAHIFANNSAFMFSQCDADIENFIVELYDAFPGAFLTPGFSGQIPFCDGIVEWIDECHQLYQLDAKGVSRVSEIKTLTKSTRVINTLCIRAEVQKFMSLPKEVVLTPKVFYSFKMLSIILDHIIQLSNESISSRREFLLASSKRRDKIIKNVAAVPFIVRTILLLDDKSQFYRLVELSVVRHIVMCKDTVDLWLLALLSGDERAKSAASHYICIISRMTLPMLYGSGIQWSSTDVERFEAQRAELYDEIGSLDGFLPTMLYLQDKLFIVSTRRAVKHIVEDTIGKPYPVYLMFMEMSFLFTLIVTYRIIYELIYYNPPSEYSTLYPEFWGLSVSIAVYFLFHDVAIIASFEATNDRLWKRYFGFGNTIGIAAMVSVLAMLTILYLDGAVENRNYIGIVAGLLWWKFLIQMKGMSEHLATLIYTILQVGGALKYFITVFLVAICFFADMIMITKQTSGECEGDGEESEFCSSNQIQSYLSMYGVMIGGIEFESLNGSSALVCILFVGATFCGLIVLVNILIAIVTAEYDKAKERSCMLFARARLEAAARDVAHDRIFRPKDDLTSGFGRKVWRQLMRRVHIAIFLCVEVFLIRSVMVSNSLAKEGMLSNFLNFGLILCTVFHHVFFLAVAMYTFVRAIKHNDRLMWLRGTKFHCTVAKICLKPICIYLRSIGLNQADMKTDPLDQLQKEISAMKEKEEKSHQQVMDNKIESAIKASEQRILSAISSLTYIATQGRS